MKHNRLQSVHPQPESQERVQPRSHSLGRGHFLLWLLCYGLLLLGLSPGVASAGGEKVTLCHVPPGNPANAQTLVVAPSAVQAHLKNHAGDHLGPCTKPPECTTNDQCNDANPCTVDTCTTAGTCEHAPVTCTSGNACADDVCIAAEGGCVAVPKPQGTACDDGDVCTNDACNGTGACVGTGVAGCCHSDADCNDNNACSTDVCSTTTHTCINTQTPPTAAACHVYVCDEEIGWIDTDVTCPNSDICTVSVCDQSIGTTGACVTQPNPNPPPGCTPLCDASQCAGLNDGLYPAADNCGEFINCTAGEGQRLSCPAGLWFNPQLQVCDWPANVNCTSVPGSCSF